MSSKARGRSTSRLGRTNNVLDRKKEMFDSSTHQPPMHLTKAQRVIWEEIVKARNAEDWKGSDLRLLGEFCLAVDYYQTLRKERDESDMYVLTPSGLMKPHPIHQLLRQAQTSMLSFANQLGLTGTSSLPTRKETERHNAAEKESKQTSQEVMDLGIAGLLAGGNGTTIN